jgi:hypothetical protein
MWMCDSGGQLGSEEGFDVEDRDLQILAGVAQGAF